MTTFIIALFLPRLNSAVCQDTVEPDHAKSELTSAIYAATAAGVLKNRTTWIGTSGCSGNTLKKTKKDQIERSLENNHHALTVDVSNDDLDAHYDHYCKVVLWPVFHYVIPDHPKSKAYEDHSWSYYVKVNQAFADCIIDNHKHKDVIWIHDYHLLLVPAMIRKKIPDARIGFFLHVAFPSSEVFRVLATRNQLLKGMLGADLVAFQTPEYARHFLQSCGRILKLEPTRLGVRFESRFVEVASVPIGIVPDQISKARGDAEVEKWTQTMMEKYAGKKLIVARDKMDNIRGIKQKLLAYEDFLERHPQWRELVVLLQVAVPTVCDTPNLDIVTRINSKYSDLSHQPLVFLQQDITHQEYLALLTVADVFMVTPLRDGMNLTCHEYILCQDGRDGHKRHGPLILSEFAGSASVLGGNELAVNPWDVRMISNTIKQALEMEAEEKDRRYDRLHALVLHHSGLRWVHELQTRLDGCSADPGTKL